MVDNAEGFQEFCDILARLRGPNGCPWDREQTHRSLKPYLIEEAYEVLQALDSEDQRKVCEELGDLLLQIGLHAQIAAESRDFNMSDVLRQINEKLVRRHPHVFGNTKVSSAGEVRVHWEEIKRAEGKCPKSLLDGIPRDIPALAYSQIVQQRASRVGFDWPQIEGVLDKVAEEVEEIRQTETQQRKTEEFGDLMFALANAARWMDVDLESALRQANDRFCRRFAKMEEFSRERGISMNGLSLPELDALWEEAKKALSG